MTVEEAIAAAQKSQSEGIPVDWAAMTMQVYQAMKQQSNEQQARIMELEKQVSDAEGTPEPA